MGDSQSETAISTENGTQIGWKDQISSANDICLHEDAHERSDFPASLKALVTPNVYDTATGMHLLIPQGSRLVGQHDSRIAYAQDGVHASWNRIIFRDASAIDLTGMVGLDSQGNAGLRDHVDHPPAARLVRTWQLPGRTTGFSASIPPHSARP